jgi:hypothetical protein
MQNRTEDYDLGEELDRREALNLVLRGKCFVFLSISLKVRDNTLNNH